MYIFITVLLLQTLPQGLCGEADDILSSTLPNGLRVIVAEDHHVNLVAIDIWIRAGSVYETPEKNGVSHFVEHMIFKATDKYGPGEIDRIIEGLGAEVNGGTSKDWQHFYTTVASEHIGIVLDVLADAILNARFDPDEIEKERGIILDEIARAESDPARLAVRVFYQTAYAVHPYKLPAMGTKESISALTRSDILDYYKMRYTPQNMIVVMVGDVKKAEALDLIGEKFGGFRRTSPEVKVQAEPPQLTHRIAKGGVTSSQSCIVVGYHGPSVSDFRDCCALDVASVVLGDTYRGRLCDALRAKKVKFTSISVDFMTQRDPSVFSVLIATDPTDAQSAAQVALSEMHKLATEGIEPSELAQAKRLIEGSDLFERETVSGRARALGLYEAIASYSLALDYIPTVRSITQADIANVALKYLTGDGYTLVTIGVDGI